MTGSDWIIVGVLVTFVVTAYLVLSVGDGED